MTEEKVFPECNPEFPAQLIATDLNWEDLDVDNRVLQELERIVNWIENENTLIKQPGFSRFTRSGYRAIFSGSPGTGKTLAVLLLGKYTGRDVYRVDLSSLISKYIGETEKALSHVFDQASEKDWILFFDEADALFGQRSNVSSSNDRFANQQTGYLLQRIEDYPGIVILASILKSNLDDAFIRRFQLIIDFQSDIREDRWSRLKK